MEFKHLLAKSCDDPENPPEAATLVGHTKAVLEAFKTLFGHAADQKSNLARRWLNFFKLSDEDFQNFYINGLLSCLFHDLGKANNGFQEMARSKGAQLVRHEHLSGLFLLCKETQEWCRKIPGTDHRLILSAVICHHLKAAPRNKNFAAYLSHTDIKRFSVSPGGVMSTLKNAIQNHIDFPLFPTSLSLPEKWNFENEQKEGTQLRNAAQDLLMKFHRELRKNNELHRLLRAVRSALIIADSAGSGLVREGKEITSWLTEAFNIDEQLNGEKIERKIIRPRIREIEEKSMKPFTWQKFQEEADNLPDRALLISACGSGKTLAAWRWIKSRLNHRPAARVIFLYPTKATASEGFRDYVSWAPEGMLLHSSSNFDLQGMFESPEDKRESNNFLVEDRLFALAYWHRKIFSATIHQFLGFMQNSYRSICLLPLLADSVVVIDEVHSFDQPLFSALKQFLGNFNIPVLCMTATLPMVRQKDLIHCGLRIFPEDPSSFEDLHKITNAARYFIRYLSDGKEEAEIVACNARSNGKKVLWVVNTVERCQLLAKNLDALCYHSRFRLEDRKKRHNEIIKAFKEEGEPLLAITTQVCEMSLDLDADVLISEVAPITSMIQRMGRCNRHLKRQTGEVYFYNPEDEKPYTEDDLKGAEEFLEVLGGKQASQNDLEELLIKYGNNAQEAERYTAFLGDLAWAESKEKLLTDIKETSVQAILSNEIFRFLELRKKKEPFDGLLVPVPKYPAELTWRDERLGKFPMVAPENHYDKRFGFTRFPLEGII